LLVVNIANPDAYIARTNLDRAVAGVGRPLDTAYLTRTLSADAVPILLAALPTLSDGSTRTGLACGLRAEADRLDVDAARRDWRGANLAQTQARAALARAGAALAGYAAACPTE
jgi:hypothetical protein